MSDTSQISRPVVPAPGIEQKLPILMEAGFRAFGATLKGSATTPKLQVSPVRNAALLPPLTEEEAIAIDNAMYQDKLWTGNPPMDGYERRRQAKALDMQQRSRRFE